MGQRQNCEADVSLSVRLVAETVRDGQRYEKQAGVATPSAEKLIALTISTDYGK
jgi:hypothetical protein